MAEDSWPSPDHNSRAVTDSEYEQLAARFTDDGVYGDPADTPVVTAGTGLTVTVRAGVTASVRGHAWASGTTDLTLTVAANSDSQARTDWVCLRLDRSTWDVTAAVKQGTPGSGSPTLAQDAGDTGLWEIPLALVNVPAAATNVSVTPWTQYVGTRIRPCTSTTRPVPRAGEMVYETDTGRWMGWDKSAGAWRTLYSQSLSNTVNDTVAAWDVVTDTVVEMRSGVVCLRLGSFTRTGGTLAGSTASRLPVLIPSELRHPTRDQYGIAYVTGLEIARFTVYSKSTDMAGQVWLTQHPDIPTGSNILTSSMTWVV